MLKKTLLSVAIASSLSLTGCLDTGKNGGNGNVEYQIENPDIVEAAQRRAGKNYPLFNPIANSFPVPNDMMFDSAAGDGTLRGSTSSPVTVAFDQLSGASTVAPIDIPISGSVDPSTVNGTAFIFQTDENGIPVSVIPNPSQSVFLIELDYASEEPITALTSGESPTIPVAVAALTASTTVDETTSPEVIAAVQAAGQSLQALATSPTYEAFVLDLNDGTSVIRINPITPLDPRKRYIVTVTNDVKDTNGEPLIPSETYESMTLVYNEGEADELPNPQGAGSLTRIQTLVNKLWEPISESYFGLPNQVRAGLGMPLLTKDNIVLSYSFTTSNDKKVLGYMAEPNTWMSDTLRTAVTTGARDAHISAGLANDYDSIKATVDGAITSWPDEATQAALGDAYLFCASQGASSGEAAITCIGSAVAGSLESNGVISTRPTATDIEFESTQDAATMTAIVAGFGILPGELSVATGHMELPYYLGQASGSDGSALVTDHFFANETTARTLNAQFGALGLELAQGTDKSNDPAEGAKSNAVNYLFPFPQKTADVKVPVLAIYPTNAALNNGNLPVIIFQHGVGTDRSTAITYGGVLAKSTGAVVVAIDQPLHGVGAVHTSRTKTEWAATLLAGGGLPTDDTTVASVVDGTFSSGITIQVAGLCPAVTINDVTDATEVGNAKLQIAGGACDGLGFDAVLGSEPSVAVGGAIVLEGTVARSSSIVPGLARTDYERHFNFAANELSQPVPMNFDEGSESGTSGSLFINLGSFITSRDNNRQMALDLLTLRHSISGKDTDSESPGVEVGGIDLDNNGTIDTDGSNVYFVGHSLGTINGTPFLAVASGTETTEDDIKAANLLTPGGGIVRLLENSPAFSPSILAGLAANGLNQRDGNYETFLNVLQTSLDAGDAINYIQDVSTPTILSMVIGDTYIPNDPASNPLGDASPTRLAGTEPLATLTNATAIESGQNALSGVSITRYTAGAHTTPTIPADDTESRVFAEMVSQSAYMIGTGGTAVIVTDTGVVQQSE